MWTAQAHELDGSVTKYTIKQNGTPVSYQAFIGLIQESEQFISFFIEILKSSPYKGFFWEVKPITSSSLAEDFEFVLVNSSILPRLSPDTKSFKEHFRQNKSVHSFPNLGGDAQLIVPGPMSDTNNYTHLANFVRHAPTDQIHLFWETVGKEYEAKIGDQRKWLSTAGLGVYWLHVRVDSRPKYYRHTPYK